MTKCQESKNDCNDRHCKINIRDIRRKLGTFEVNQTVYVDAEYGNDLAGELNSSIRPFRTIQAAINTIPSQNTIPWSVVIRPGKYDETVNVPVFVNLIGSGNNTIISRLIVTGASQISNLNVVGSQLPLIEVAYSGEDVNGQVVFNQVGINVSQATSALENIVVSLRQPSGINGEVLFMDSSIEANFTGLVNPNGKIILVNADGLVANFVDTNLSLTMSFQPTATFIRNSSANVNVQDGYSHLIVIQSSPLKNIVFFDSVTGFTEVTGHTSLALIEIMGAPDTTQNLNTIVKVFPSPNQANDDGIVIYAQASLAGLFKAYDVVVDFSSVPIFIRSLGNVVDQSSRVTLLNVKTPLSRAFPVTGIVQNISYVVLSEQANIVANGGLYTNIVEVNEDLVGGPLYPVQDSDYTILVSDPVVKIGLPDPVIASESVIYKGKIIVVKNISTTDVHIEGQNPDTIYDGNQTIPPKIAIQFQNNGVFWYVI